MTALKDYIGIALGLIALGTAIAGWIRWGRPRWKATVQRRKDKDTVLLGREAVPANPITGAPAQDAIPSIGQQMAFVLEQLQSVMKLANEMHHELHPNSGKSLRDTADRSEKSLIAILKRLADGDARFDGIDQRLARMETVLDDELAVATDTVANAAEASRTALQVIDAAIRAEPPH